MVLKWVLLLGACYLGYHHVSTIFENDRFFSHLSELEREMTFRTEAGFYYMFFKIIARAPSFREGWQELVNDTGTEYPTPINTLQRFNVYPEVLIGGVFRLFRGTVEYFDVLPKFRQCYGIKRGEGMSQVQSCVGAAEEPIFYTNVVFMHSGLLAGAIFLLGCHMAGDTLGGILALSALMFNWHECSRVQWIPPLRESFSFPFLILQLLCVSDMLKGGPTRRKQTTLFLMTVCFVLPWQFTQFVLLTQTMSLLGCYALRFIAKERVVPVLDAVFCGYVVATLLQFLNTMLISSLYVSAYLAFKVLIATDSKYPLKSKILQFLRAVAVFLAVAATYKVGSASVFQLSDDAHIYNIFRSKFSDFRDFHTMLYICSKAFDFIEFKFFENLTWTLLLPVTGLVVGRLLYVFGMRAFATFFNSPVDEHENGASVGDTQAEADDKLKTKSSKDESSGTDSPSPKPKTQLKRGSRQPGKKVEQKKSSPPAADPVFSEEDTNSFLMYHVFQFTCFFFMAVLLMRLKMFVTPYMCLLCSLVASNFVLPQSQKSRYVIGFLLMGLMSIQGYANLRKEYSTEREYSNPPQEHMLEWVMKRTPQDAVFAGPMSVMANLRLSTMRQIVNHPHYEDQGLRDRTHLVYQMYSRKPVQEVHNVLKSLGVQYAVLDKNWCVNNRPKSGCAIPEIWDMEDVVNRDKDTFCNMVKTRPDLFDLAFSNKMYRVIKLKY